MDKPVKPSPDFPLFANSNGQWAKKIKGVKKCFGPWADPDAALRKYEDFIAAQTPKVTAKSQAGKPSRPYPSFPLSPCTNGQWGKIIRGKRWYFGAWADPQAALAKFNREKDDLAAGRVPRTTGDGLTVLALINHFTDAKRKRVETGQLKPRTLEDYITVCDRVLKVFGAHTEWGLLTPADFEKLRTDFASTHAAVALGCDIGRVRVLANYADETFQVRAAIGKFKKPTKSEMRRERASRPKKMFTAREIRTMLRKATPNMKAMILLGINCGFGNNDCALLTTDKMDLDGRWHYFPRPKTGIERRCPLWPETVRALRAVVARRPAMADPALAGRVFITAKGGSFEWLGQDNPISKEMRKLLIKCGFYQKGVNFYALRHTFRTIGKRPKGKETVEFIMGHAPESDDMGAVYDEETFDDDLKTVTKFVRAWVSGRSRQRSAPRRGRRIEASSSEPTTGPRLRLVGHRTEPEPLPIPGSGAGHRVG